MRRDGGDQRGIVVLRSRALLVDANIRAEQNGTERPPRKMRDEGVEAVIVEAHAVDDGLVWFKAEQTWAWVAGLRPRCDGAGFDEAEAEPHERGDGDGVLVEAGGQTDRIGEALAEDADRQSRVIIGRYAASEAEAQSEQGQVVGSFRIDPAQQRQQGGGEHLCHGRLPYARGRAAPEGQGSANHWIILLTGILATAARFD